MNPNTPCTCPTCAKARYLTESLGHSSSDTPICTGDVTTRVCDSCIACPTSSGVPCTGNTVMCPCASCVAARYTAESYARPRILKSAQEVETLLSKMSRKLRLG